MSLLHADMNLDTFPRTTSAPIPLTSVKAPAIVVITSMTSSCASAHANAAAIESNTALRTIARIDLNVLLRQIARPEAGRALASPVQGETDQALLLVELFLEIGLGEIRSQPAPAHRHVLEIDIHFARIKRHAGIPRSRENPAPVGIGARDGGLDQRRIGDAARDLRGHFFVRRATDLNGHQLPRAFAVAHDLACQV